MKNQAKSLYKRNVSSMEGQALTDIARCPICKEQLRSMNQDEIEEINAKIVTGKLFHADGTVVQRSILAGLISINGNYAYRVDDDIAILLEGLAIVLGSKTGVRKELQQENNIVQQFYDQFGWQKDESGTFKDQIAFEDLRPVSKDYRYKCDLRVKRYLKAGGKYLLDAASGPIPRPEYLMYSEGYDYRVCVDFSYLALMEAKKTLGEKGIYILGDVTNLPLSDDSVDGVVSLHTVYHLPSSQQRAAIDEVYRVVKRGCSAVVVYSWGGCSFIEKHPIKLIGQMARAVSILRKVMRGTTSKGPTPAPTEWSLPALYAHMHDYKWFKRQKTSYKLQLVCWRSLPTEFMKYYVRPSLWGQQFLRLVYFFEETFPYIAGRAGAYPMFVIRK